MMAENYFSQFGDKACCYEDLLPYLAFEGEELEQWTSFLNSRKSFVSIYLPVLLLFIYHLTWFAEKGHP